ncbi:MAG TPA: hypothetical protein VGW38_12520 [Chloroflexota bacterium]|nr:hypothetical protein [Chloroflexota bacterium]
MQQSSPEAPMVVDHDDPDAIAKVAAAYALDALTAHETRQVRDHLPGCIKCREEVARMREAAGVLAYAVEPVQPPDDLRGALLDRSRKEADQPPGIHLLPDPE